MIQSTSHDERGFVLVPVMFIVLILGGLAAAFLTEGLGDRTSLKHRESSMKALEIAEAGLHRAQLAVYAMPDAFLEDGIETLTGQLGGGPYEVVCQRDPALPDRWTLTSRGENRNSVRRIEVGIRRREKGYFIEGLFSRLELDLNGDIQTDSFHSKDGTWHEQIAEPVPPGLKQTDAFGDYIGTVGHVGSNEGIVTGGTAVSVRGNAVAGPGFTTDLNGDPTIQGDMVPREFVIPLPPPPIGDFQDAEKVMNAMNAAMVDGLVTGIAAPLNGLDLTLAGDLRTYERNIGYDANKLSLAPKGDVILKGGTYLFTDVTLLAGAKLIIEAPSTIYITGSLSLTGGGLVNESGQAADCLIFAHPYKVPSTFTAKKVEVKITGGAEVAAAIYAPDVDVNVGGNGHLFGSIVGKTIDVTGTAYFHYDEALRDVLGGVTVMLERLYWRELSPAPR